MKGSKQPRLSHNFAALQHSHKKRKDSLETISGVVVQDIHQNSEKVACSEDFLFSF